MDPLVTYLASEVTRLNNELKTITLERNGMIENVITNIAEIDRLRTDTRRQSVELHGIRLTASALEDDRERLSSEVHELKKENSRLRKSLKEVAIELSDTRHQSRELRDSAVFKSETYHFIAKLIKYRYIKADICKRGPACSYTFCMFRHRKENPIVEEALTNTYGTYDEQKDALASSTRDHRIFEATESPSKRINTDESDEH